MAMSLGRAVRRIFLRLLALVLLAALAYGAWAWFDLNRKLAAIGAGDREVRYELASPSDGPMKTSLPFVVRAIVKRRDAQNWLPTEKGGLVEKRYAWSPGEWKWVEDPPPDLAVDERLDLELLSRMPPPSLIDALLDQDPHRREVAARALRIETGEEFGYRFDLPPERRAEAAAACRKWWEQNKVRYGKEKLEKVFKGAGEPGR